jgi:GNAT superfamily N-acetyltransferase
MSNPIALIARCAVAVRPALAGDYAFIDRLQAMHSKALGFMRKAALEGKIKLGEVFIAEEIVDCGMLNVGKDNSQQSTLNNQHSRPIGYCIFSNRYLKRDELGVVYQMNIAPEAQRKLVAATLLKAVFERAPYGCKLFCCWCAQDLDANHFWETLGFIPLAFRTGAVGKKTRTHIFWQRRIREGDVSTPYWFPSKTDGGMMREDRIVLPIPPGVHWKDPMPILIPEVQKALPEPGKELSGKGSRAAGGDLKPRKTKAQVQTRQPLRGLSFAPVKAVVEKPKAAKPKREKVKADPKHVAAARELRDRYLEQFNSGLILPAGKYAVGRVLEANAMQVDAKRLPQAA